MRVDAFRHVMPLVAIPDLTPAPTDPDTAAQAYWDQTKSVFLDALMALYMLRKEDPATGISKYQFSFDTGFWTYSDALKAVYLPFSCEITIFQAGAVLPIGVTADSLTLRIVPGPLLPGQWSQFMPLATPPLKEIYYSHIEETTVPGFLWAGFTAANPPGSSTLNRLLQQYGSTYPNASDEDVVLGALMDHQESFSLSGGWQIAEMAPDAADPTRLRLDVMFTCGDPHSDENTRTYFRYLQRMHDTKKPGPGDVIINYHLTGHPMIVSMLAEAQIDTTFLGDEEIEDQTQSLAMLLLEAARVDVMDRTLLPSKHNTKFDTTTLFVDPDTAPPTVRVQAQLSLTAKTNIEAIFPHEYIQGSGLGAATSFEDVLQFVNFLDINLSTEEYGRSRVPIYNPDGIDLYFNALNDAGAPASEYAVSHSAGVDVVNLAVTSLVETEANGTIEVRSGSQSGPLLFTLQVLILEFRALPVRFFQARNTVGGVEQHAGDMTNDILFFDKMNHLLNVQANILIIPTVADPLNDPLYQVLDMETPQPLGVPLTVYEVRAHEGDPKVARPSICGLHNDVDFSPLGNGKPVRVNVLTVWSFDRDPIAEGDSLGLTLGDDWWSDYCSPIAADCAVIFLESTDGVGSGDVPYTAAHELIHATDITSNTDPAETKYISHSHPDAPRFDCYHKQNLMAPGAEFNPSQKNIRLTARQARILNNLLAADYSWG